MFDVHDCIGFLTSRGAKVVCEAMNEQFKKKNITRVQWMALYYISENHSITQKELAHVMMVSEPSVAHLVERLQQAELIERTSSPVNYRVNILSLTEKGEEVLRELFPLVEQFNQDAVQGFSQEELDTFKRVMETMIRNVQNEDL